MNQKEQKICRDIKQHGHDILCSDLFQQAGRQAHHLRSTVSDHSLNVCITGVRLCSLLQHFGIRLNEKEIIQASLCHDLGMVGRDRKYRTRLRAWRFHPDESAKLAKSIVPDLDPSVESIIKTHMWPGPCGRPQTKEGVVLNVADKYASIADWTSAVTGRRYKDRIKQVISG